MNNRGLDWNLNDNNWKKHSYDVINKYKIWMQDIPCPLPTLYLPMEVIRGQGVDINIMWRKIQIFLKSTVCVESTMITYDISLVLDNWGLYPIHHNY